mmetsp:Transcript_4036/g.9631  ORF Transcript_4036/g.9631 Transcript_4036/m.9631 type:complete len:361 (-) Transcript_4036:3937-5019(-)
MRDSSMSDTVGSRSISIEGSSWTEERADDGALPMGRRRVRLAPSPPSSSIGSISKSHSSTMGSGVFGTGSSGSPSPSSPSPSAGAGSPPSPSTASPSAGAASPSSPSTPSSASSSPLPAGSPPSSPSPAASSPLPPSVVGRRGVLNNGASASSSGSSRSKVAPPRSSPAVRRSTLGRRASISFSHSFTLWMICSRMKILSASASSLSNHGLLPLPAMVLEATLRPSSRPADRPPLVRPPLSAVLLRPGVLGPRCPSPDVARESSISGAGCPVDGPEAPDPAVLPRRPVPRAGVTSGFSAPAGGSRRVASCSRAANSCCSRRGRDTRMCGNTPSPVMATTCGGKWATATDSDVLITAGMPG